jgi:hypothetical protein
VRGLLHVRRAKNGTPSVQPLGGIESRALRKLKREEIESRFVVNACLPRFGAACLILCEVPRISPIERHVRCRLNVFLCPTLPYRCYTCSGLLSGGSLTGRERFKSARLVPSRANHRVIRNTAPAPPRKILDGPELFRGQSMERSSEKLFHLELIWPQRLHSMSSE